MGLQDIVGLWLIFNASSRTAVDIDVSESVHRVNIVSLVS